ncbi:hypothetical protein [Planomicrobium sp. CPCC 101110]|uniref:hypothetical protein n=1 Tax=Planomicrobium sp. CPCC 101110 TaxID=2599619 RepID=UPI0011B425C2|nr:hypothetical protein [Planomicrobium sp. CPCC 101110]TWT27240.1 hypothetical protein FQV30_01600 [Planomicrobium sp. CPCC 101110]
MMNFSIDEKEMIFENEHYITKMLITGKGKGQDRGEPRLRCAVSISLEAKETGNDINLRANIYWDAKYPKTHLFFSGGSLVAFIDQQGLEYGKFKEEYWDKVKRLASNVFTDEEILEYQKMMDAVKA